MSERQTTSEWTRHRLVDLCETHVDCVNRTAVVVDGPTPYRMIRTTNVDDGFIDTQDVKFVDAPTFTRWTRRLLPQRGDVILTREAPLGNVGILRKQSGIFLGQRLYHFRPDKTQLPPSLFMYALMTEDVQGQIRGFGSGATVEHMRLEDIPRLEVDLPPPALRGRVAAALLVFDELRFVNEERIRLLDTAIRLHYGIFVRSNSSWTDGSLSDVAKEVRANVPKGPREATPYVGLEHLSRRSLALQQWEETQELGSNKLAFQRGDVLFSKIRPYLHKVCVAPFEGVCSADTIVIRPTDSAYAGFVIAHTSSDQFVAEASGSANGSKMPRANWSFLSRRPLRIPTRPEAEQFDSVVQPLLELQQVLVAQNKQLRRARQLLLPALFSRSFDAAILPDSNGLLDL